MALKKSADAVEKPVSGGAPEEDDDEWEDASDGADDDDNAEEEEKCPDEKKGVRKDTKSAEKTAGSLAPSTPSPKQQRTPKPKVRMPSPQEIFTSQEPTKPLSPFSPPEGHQPVTDWGEEMEMLSPKSSLGESPLRPSSNDSSPAQNKSREESICEATGHPAESDEQDDAQPGRDALIIKLEKILTCIK